MYLIDDFNLIKYTLITFFSKYFGDSQHLLETFNNALPLFLSLITLFAIYIYYNKNKYTISYKLKKTNEIDKSPKSVNNIIENSNSIFYILKYIYGASFLIWIIWFLVLAFVYYIFGYIGVKISIAIIFSLHIIVFSKLYAVYCKNQIEEGQKNFGYISLHIMLLSAVKLLIHIRQIVKKRPTFSVTIVKSFLDKLSVKGYLRNALYVFMLFWTTLRYIIVLPFILIRPVIFVLVCILIPSVLVLNDWIFFFIYLFLLLFYYVVKCMPLYQSVKSMSKEPMFVNLEMLDGEIIENLLLYQTTLTDYRFKSYNTHKEYIVPYSNVKKISEDYDFELKQLDNVIDQKYDFPLKNIGSNGNFIKKYVDELAKQVMHKVWYKKAKIYVKINDLSLAKIALEKAVESVKYTTFSRKKNKRIYLDFILLLETDNEFNKFHNCDWFIELVNQPYEDTIYKKLTSSLLEYSK